MGLFDEMAGKAVSGVLGNSSNPLAHQLLQMINDHPGGLTGMVQGFQQKGLGDIVNSWVGTGQNLPISADQVHSALGSGMVQELAAKAGISPDTASSAVAQLLPMLVDKLTPNGQVPQQGNLMETGMQLLNSLRSGTNG